MNKRRRRLRVRKMLGVSFMIGMIGWATAIEIGLPSAVSDGEVSESANVVPS
jgi:hypothetical protein